MGNSTQGSPTAMGANFGSSPQSGAEPNSTRAKHPSLGAPSSQLHVHDAGPGSTNPSTNVGPATSPSPEHCGGVSPARTRACTIGPSHPGGGGAPHDPPLHGPLAVSELEVAGLDPPSPAPSALDSSVAPMDSEDPADAADVGPTDTSGPPPPQAAIQGSAQHRTVSRSVPPRMSPIVTGPLPSSPTDPSPPEHSPTAATIRGTSASVAAAPLGKGRTIAWRHAHSHKRLPSTASVPWQPGAEQKLPSHATSEFARQCGGSGTHGIGRQHISVSQPPGH